MIPLDSILFLISSTKGYEAAAARCIASLATEASRVVVYGGWVPMSRSWEESHPCVDSILDEQNSFDWTGLIGLLDGPGFFSREWVLCLHDTMECGPDTVRLVCEANPDAQATSPYLGECNLALYRTDYIESQRDWILARRNISKAEAIRFERVLWERAERREHFLPVSVDIQRGAPSPYGGVPRERHYYAGLDIVKWKANHGQGREPVVAL